jgi:hypothetical protein
VEAALLGCSTPRMSSVEAIAPAEMNRIQENDDQFDF